MNDLRRAAAVAAALVALAGCTDDGRGLLEDALDREPSATTAEVTTTTAGPNPAEDVFVEIDGYAYAGVPDETVAEFTDQFAPVGNQVVDGVTVSALTSADDPDALVGLMVAIAFDEALLAADGTIPGIFLDGAAGADAADLQMAGGVRVLRWRVTEQGTVTVTWGFSTGRTVIEVIAEARNEASALTFVERLVSAVT